MFIFTLSQVSSLASISLETLDEAQLNEILPVIENIKHTIQTDIIGTAITSTCVGMAPPEVLEPMTDLIRAILMFSQWSDIESSVAGAINCGQFNLGDDAKSVAFDAFRKEAESDYISANFGKIILEMWEMHQTDDTGSIAGGEAVLDFVQRYKNN